MIQEFSALDGALLIDKPAGPTSHDVVDAIRRRFGIKKVGHCGTLDPNATGLLIIVLGRGTKLSEKLMSDDKVYEGVEKALRKYFGKRGDRVVQENLNWVKRGYSEMQEILPAILNG